MQDGEQVAATPRLGLAKGIIAILLGVIAGGTALTVVIGSTALLGLLMLAEIGIHRWLIPIVIIVAFLLPPAIFGLCLWRGILAIRRRKLKRVTYLNFTLWVVPLVTSVLVPISLAVLLISLPGQDADTFWAALLVPLILVPLVPAAVGVAAYFDRKKSQTMLSRADRRRLTGIIAASVGVLILIGVLPLVAVSVMLHYAAPQYELIIDSTGGGSVTTPGEGPYTYDKGAIVSLLATPDAGYQFVNWSGDVDTVADIGAATTTIVMGGDNSITANFDEWTPLNNTPMVAAGTWHTVGLNSDGTVVAVGRNDDGQCDVGSWTDIVQVAAGGLYTVGLRPDGTVLAVGSNEYAQGEVGGWTAIVQVSAGWGHTVGLKSYGTVVAVGNNSYGQCGVGSWTDIVQVAAGGRHTVGLRSDGTVLAVGYNQWRQCNVGGWTDIVQIAASGQHTVGLKSDGTVVAVGDNDDGQCDVGSWTDIVQVAAGVEHTVGLKADGTVVAVGWNYSGGCDVGEWTDIVQVAALHHTLGLKADGTVVAAGPEVELARWNLLEATP